MSRPKGRPAPSRARPITEQVLAAIRESGLSTYAIGRASGVQRSVIDRFASGERGITLDTLDRLAPALGLRLIRGARKPRPGTLPPAGDPAGAAGSGPLTPTTPTPPCRPAIPTAGRP